jgi:hypothetical protein
MAKNLILRHKVAKAVRDYFDANRFLEVETPILFKSTPEGAREYLVPSRVNPGKFVVHNVGAALVLAPAVTPLPNRCETRIAGKFCATATAAKPYCRTNRTTKIADRLPKTTTTSSHPVTSCRKRIVVHLRLPLWSPQHRPSLSIPNRKVPKRIRRMTRPIMHRIRPKTPRPLIVRTMIRPQCLQTNITPIPVKPQTRDQHLSRMNAILNR